MSKEVQQIEWMSWNYLERSLDKRLWRHFTEEMREGFWKEIRHDSLVNVLTREIVNE